MWVSECVCLWPVCSKHFNADWVDFDQDTGLFVSSMPSFKILSTFPSIELGLLHFNSFLNSCFSFFNASKVHHRKRNTTIFALPFAQCMSNYLPLIETCCFLNALFYPIYLEGKVVLCDDRNELLKTSHWIFVHSMDSKIDWREFFVRLNGCHWLHFHADWKESMCCTIFYGLSIEVETIFDAKLTNAYNHQLLFPYC